MSEFYKTVALSTVVKINSGIALPKIFKDIKNTQGEYQFFKVAQMNNDKKIMKGAELKFTETQSKEFKIKLFPKGSVLIPKRGGAILTNKKRLLTEEASYDSNIMGLKADNTVLTDEFLIVYMDSINLSDYIDTSTIPQINNKHIEMMKIPLPPLQEQKRIVSKLNTLFEKIDKSIALHQKNMDEADVFMGSVLNDVFEELEEKYGKTDLKDIAIITMGQSPKSTTYNVDGLGMPFFQGKKEFGKLNPTVEKYCTEPKKVAKNGDILMSVRAPVGPTNIANLDCAIGRGLCSIRGKENQFTMYIYYFLNHFEKDIEKMGKGSTFSAINKKETETLKVPFVSLNIQRKTVAYLDKISKKIEKIKLVQKEKMESLVALKASILDQSFRGEL